MLSISYYDGVKYHSSEFMNRDKDFFGNGVVQAAHFPYTLPTPNNMTLSIGAGVAWVDGFRIGNDSSAITLTVSAADATNPRIDIVQIGHDDINSQAVLTIKKGVAAASPTEPSADPNYVKLYAINVAANATSITAGNITDRRTLVPLNVSATQIVSGGSAGTGQTNNFTQTQTFSDSSAPINITSLSVLPAVGPKDTLVVVNNTWYHSDGTNWNSMAPAAPVTSVNSKTGAVSLTASDVSAIPTTQLGVANGVATLDNTGKVPSTQLPSMNYIPTSAEGVANGVATLDNTGKVPSAQLPSMNYVPTSAEGTANGVATLDSNGYVPKAQLGNGVTSFNGSTGAVTYTAPVTSVNGQTGAVTVQVYNPLTNPYVRLHR